MRYIVSLACVCAAGLVLAVEDVYQDALLWLRANSDVNENGFIDEDEVVDALNPRYADAIKPYGWLKGASGGTQLPDGDFVWTNDTVVVPYTHRTIPNALNYGFRQSLRTSDKAALVNTICMSDIASKITSDNWSCHMRFKWAGSKLSAQTQKQFLLMAGKVGNEGMTSGLNWAVDTEGRFVTAIGADFFMTYNTNVTKIEPDKWTDVVWVFKSGENITCYVIQEGGDLAKKSVSCVNKKYRPASAGMFLIGNNTNRTTWEALTGALVYNAFRGQINQFAVWNKTLSDEEVKAVLGWPGTDLVRFGIVNGSADEFEGDGEIASGAVDGDCGWGAFGGALAVGESKSLAFVTPLRYNGLPQLLRWRGASDSASGMVEVTVNGRALEPQAVGSSRWTNFAIPGECFVADAVTTVTLRRTDRGTGTLTLDALTIGGSWQLGKIGPANQETWEWGYKTGSEVSVDAFDGNYKNFRDRLNAGEMGRILFDLPASVADRYDYTVKMRSVFESATHDGRANIRLAVYVNGIRAYEEERSYGAWYDREFSVPVKALVAGRDDIVLRNEGDLSGATGYFAMDYLQLLVGDARRGLLVIFR